MGAGREQTVHRTDFPGGLEKPWKMPTAFRVLTIALRALTIALQALTIAFQVLTIAL